MRLDHNLSLFNGFSDARVPMVGTFGGGQWSVWPSDRFVGTQPHTKQSVMQWLFRHLSIVARINR